MIRYMNSGGKKHADGQALIFRHLHLTSPCLIVLTYKIGLLIMHM